jgi:hypothetical protein
MKNLIMALTGTLDRHFTALWDHCHIKLWSKKTLSILLREAGFTQIAFLRVGRIPALAKSMMPSQSVLLREAGIELGSLERPLSSNTRW